MAWPCGRTMTSTTHHHPNYDHPITHHPPPIACHLSPAPITRSSLCQINLWFCNSVCKTMGLCIMINPYPSLYGTVLTGMGRGSAKKHLTRSPPTTRPSLLFITLLSFHYATIYLS